MKLKRGEAIELAERSEEWKKFFPEGKTFDHATLEVVPNQRVELHVISESLAGSKKSKKKSQNSNQSQNSHKSDDS